MLMIFVLDCNPNSYLHLVFSLRSVVVGHFLYIVSWEEILNLSTIVTFPPVVRRKWRPWMYLSAVDNAS